MSKRIIYPNEVYDYLQERNLVQRIVKYVLNWKGTRTAIYLKKWLEDQMVDAFKDVELLEFVKLTVGSYYQTEKYDKIMLKILQKCGNYQGFLQYKTDDYVWSVKEYWQKYWETFEKRTGDCEDGAILMYVMARVAGVPSNRLLLFAGTVTGGGHCWLAYRPTFDPLHFRFIDWCYYTTYKDMDKRPLFWVVGNEIRGDDPRYKTMWWCFNENNTYVNFKPTAEK